MMSIPSEQNMRKAVAGNPRTERLVEVARYIEKHADQPLTLSFLSDIAGLSPSRLQRVFKEAFGVSPKAYQDAVRMRCFKRSLKDGYGVTDAIFLSRIWFYQSCLRRSSPQYRYVTQSLSSGRPWRDNYLRMPYHGARFDDHGCDRQGGLFRAIWRL